MQSTLYKIGRLLQFAGLLILPIAVAGDAAEKLELKESLALSGIGMLIFGVGWSIQQGSRPK